MINNTTPIHWQKLPTHGENQTIHWQKLPIMQNQPIMQNPTIMQNQHIIQNQPIMQNQHIMQNIPNLKSIPSFINHLFFIPASNFSPENKPIQTYLDSLFSFNLPYYFLNKIEEINAIFGQQQIENINTTLNLIDNNKYDKLESIKKCNTLKCIQWCQQHKLDYNGSIQQNNIFLMNKRM
jgi:hypothetical protein